MTLILAAASAVLALAAVGFMLVHRTSVSETFRAQTSTNCAELEKIKAQIRGVFQESLESARQRSVRGEIDAAQWRLIQDYYGRQLARFAPIDCPNP